MSGCVTVKPEGSKISCFMCGSEDVDVATEFDYHCSSAPTTACICGACGASWYDDTIEVG